MQRRSRSIPTLGYPSLTEAVWALKQQGKTPAEIAAAIDRPLKSVKALTISAARADHRRAAPAERNGRTVLFPADVLDRLRWAAGKRAVSVNELARRIVETAVDDNMIDAILDDQHGSAA